MDLGDLVTEEGIVPSLNATTKKQSLQELARHASEMTGIPQRDVFDALLQRERLGSTGLGRGIAVPHVKFKSLKQIVCIFARLDNAIDFEAADDDPVDLIFLLLAPEHASGDHLKALARISRLLREPDVSAQLRASRDSGTILSVLRQPATPHAA
ncbi:MAG: PTS sugar transporter subunit IIA [Pseudomonadota bacterium]